jgi:LEA14-like dessication related protein
MSAAGGRVRGRESELVLVLVFVLVFVLVLGSCATIGKAVIAQPEVTLRDVRLTSVGFDGGVFLVLIKVYNPNDFDLDASDLTYQVLVDDAVIGQGSDKDPVTVPAKDSMMVKLPLRISWATAGPAGQSLIRAGAVNYEIKGSMKIASGVGSLPFSYDQHGQFNALAKH